MAEFQEVMKQKKRMCAYYKNGLGCNACLLHSHINCNNYIVDKAKDTEERIMAWAKEHPVKTNLDKLLEVFPMVDRLKMIRDDSCMGFECCDCSCVGCEHNGFWLREYEDPKNLAKEGSVNPYQE